MASPSDSCHAAHEGPLAPSSVRVMAVPSMATQLVLLLVAVYLCAVIFSRRCYCCFKLCVTETQCSFWANQNYDTLKSENIRTHTIPAPASVFQIPVIKEGCRIIEMPCDGCAMFWLLPLPLYKNKMKTKNMCRTLRPI